MSTVKEKSKPQSLQPANAFVGKKSAPTEKELASVLGKTKAVWDEIVAGLQSDVFKVRDSEWKCPAAKYGWSLRLKRAGRNIVYLSPVDHGFWVAFVLGKKAVNAALASDLSATTKELIREAPIYPEGTGIRFEVHSQEDVEIVMKLARFKLEN